MTMPTPLTPEQQVLVDKLLDERKKGNIVLRTPFGDAIVNLDEFIKQPADGMLYDLHRLEEVSLTLITDPKWINDYAVAVVIRKLITQRGALTARVAKLEAVRRALEIVLPMAKGYAYEHRVGSNVKYIEMADEALAACHWPMPQGGG